METEEFRKVENGIYGILFLWALTALFAHHLGSLDAQKAIVIKSQQDTISQYYLQYQISSQTNLILREYISGKQEKKLMQDSTYLYLINKIK